MVGLTAGLLTMASALADPAAATTPQCYGFTATKIGTSSNDQLQGAAARDVIVGLGGNDTINGLGGDDEGGRKDTARERLLRRGCVSGP
jgi:hypothetical protein